LVNILALPLLCSEFNLAKAAKGLLHKSKAANVVAAY